MSDRDVELWQGWLDEMAKACNYLAKRGPELLHLWPMVATIDGYGAGGGGEGHGSNPQDSSTVMAVLRRMERDCPRCACTQPCDHERCEECDLSLPEVNPDEIHEWLTELFNRRKTAQSDIRRMAHLAERVAKRGDVRVGRHVTGGDCVVCGTYVSGAVNDRRVRGMCGTCRRAHDRWKVGPGAGDQADMVAFRRHRDREQAQPEQVAATGGA